MMQTILNPTLCRRSPQLVTFAGPWSALWTCIIARLCVDLIHVQVGRCFTKHHVTAVILKVRLHCQRHAQLFCKEGLCGGFAQVDTHAHTTTFCKVPTCKRNRCQTAADCCNRNSATVCKQYVQNVGCKNNESSLHNKNQTHL